MAFADTAELAVHLTLDDKFSRQIRGAGSSLSKFEGSVKKVGKGVGQIGAGFARAGLVVGGAAVTGIAAAAKAAIDFQDAFAGVRKTVDERELTAAGLSFDKLALSFRKMATEIPIAATEFAAIGETAGALGIKAKDIETFTKTVALLGVTTNLTSAEAAERLGKVGTVLGLTGKGFTNFADILVNLGNKGASTESEIIGIAERFGAAGKQAGLSVPQILAFSSAIASAGVEVEAGGSSLSRIFGNLITETALASDKGKAFAKISGKSFKDFSKIVKKDTVGAMLTFLKHLKTLSKFGQQKALKAVGITNVRDRNAILLLASTYEKNLIPALDNANKSQGALAAEATKRFDTIASKLKLFKQNLIEAGITIGEGFLPALGRATDKLIAFLKLDTTKTGLKSLGEDIGKAIDAVNWQEVLDGAKKLVGFAKDAFFWADKLFNAFNALPGPIKEATAGFLVINKLSSGLIGSGVGNIVGGLGETVTRALGSKLPGPIGKLFVQPVFVTNFPPGMGLGGGLPGAVGKGFSLASLIPLVAVAAAELAVADFVGPGLRSELGVEAGGQGTVKGEIAGFKVVVGRSIAALVHPLNTIVANTTSLKSPAIRPPGHDQTRNTGTGLLDQRHGEQGGSALLTAVQAAPPKLDSLHQAVATGATNIHSVVGVKGDAIRSQTASSGSSVAIATSNGADRIVGAIWAARPNINVTNVTKTTTIQQRIGPGNGSYGGGVGPHNEIP